MGNLKGLNSLFMKIKDVETFARFIRDQVDSIHLKLNLAVFEAIRKILLPIPSACYYQFSIPIIL
jgi:hypothetical protein